MSAKDWAAKWKPIHVVVLHTTFLAASLILMTWQDSFTKQISIWQIIADIHLHSNESALVKGNITRRNVVVKHLAGTRKRSGLMTLTTLRMMSSPVMKSMAAKLKTKMLVFVCSSLSVEITTTTSALLLHIRTSRSTNDKVTGRPPVTVIPYDVDMFLPEDEVSSITASLGEMLASSVTFIAII